MADRIDHSMLTHLLLVLRHLGSRHVELLCVDALPGIEPYDGLGKLKSLPILVNTDRLTGPFCVY